MRAFPRPLRRLLASPSSRPVSASVRTAPRAPSQAPRDASLFSRWGLKETGAAGLIGLAFGTGGVVFGDAELAGIGSFGDIGTAIWRLKGNNVASVGDGVGMLEQILGARGGRDIIVNGGGVEGLVDVVRRGKGLGGTAVLGACRVLGDLAGFEKGEDRAEVGGRMARFVKDGVVEAMVGVLKDCGGVAAGRPEGWIQMVEGWVGLGRSSSNSATGSGIAWDKNVSDGVTCHAVRCLGELARLGSVHERLAQAGAIDCFSNVLLNVPIGKIDHFSSLRDAIGSEELAETLRYAILGLAALSETHPKVVSDSGALSALVRLTGQSIDETSQAHAAKALRNLAKNDEIHRPLVLAGAGPALRKALSNERNGRAQVRAASALGHLVSSKHPKAHIIQRRLARDLAALPDVAANADDIRVRKAASKALEIVYENIHVADNAFTPLREAVDRNLVRLIYLVSVAECSIMAMNVIRLISKDPQICKAVIGKGGAEELMTKMEAKDKDIAGTAVDALASVTDATDELPKPLRERLLKAVIDHPSGYRGGKPTAAILANLARMKDTCIEFAAEPPMRLLMQLATSHDKHARSAHAEVARALYNMSLDGVSGSNIVHSGGVPTLLRLALNKGTSRRYAVAAISNLAESHSDSQANAAIIMAAGAIPLLTRMAEEDSDITSHVVECFALLSNIATTHKTIAQNALMLLFRTMETGDEESQAMAAYAVCNVASSKELRPMILKSPRFMSQLETYRDSPNRAEAGRVCGHALSNLRGSEPILFLRAERRKIPAPA